MIFSLKASWNLALSCNTPEVWEGVAAKAMEQLDIDLAWRVFVETKDTAMAMAIQTLRYIEDKNLLAGHICMLSGKYNEAQVSFLASTAPLEALQMRRDLLHWDHALLLAEQLAKDEIPTISREYAGQLEVKGEFEQALGKSTISLALLTVQDELFFVGRTLRACSEIKQKHKGRAPHQTHKRGDCPHDSPPRRHA